MLRKKTSILFINTGSKETKPVQVPSTVIKNWKKYILAFTLVIFALIGVIAWLVYQKTDEHYQDKLADVNQKLTAVSKVVNIPKLKKSFNSIDSSLLRINEFLKQKGLGEMKVPNVGGEESFEIADINEVIAFYEKYVKRIEEKVNFTPIGAPYNGVETSNFGYRDNPFTGGGVESHFGVDFRGKTGDPIKSTAGGKVIFAGVRGGYGNCIIVEHENSFQTLYGHLSKIVVKQGMNVKAGQIIGLLGSTGRSTGPHLHYEIIRNGEKINPEGFLKL